MILLESVDQNMEISFFASPNSGRLEKGRSAKGSTSLPSDLGRKNGVPFVGLTKFGREPTQTKVYARVSVVVFEVGFQGSQRKTAPFRDPPSHPTRAQHHPRQIPCSAPRPAARPA